MRASAGPLAAALVAVLSLTSASRAGAQQPLVPVWIRDDQPGVTHRLITREGAVVGTCVGDCMMQIPIGTYVLESSETEELRRGKQKVVIDGPTVIDVSPGSKSTRSTGLAVGIVGSAAVVVGAIGVLIAASAAKRCSDRSFGPPYECSGPSYAPWLITLGAGAALTTTGWIMFGSSGTRVQTSPYARTVSLGAAPIPSGGLVGATFVF